MIRTVLLGSLCAFSMLAFAAPASAETANLLGVFGNWSAYSTGTGNGMTCYAMSKPRAKQPKATKRGDIFLMVSDWPGRKVKAEMQIVPGYEYKANAPVTLAVGPDKFNFFSRNEAMDIRPVPQLTRPHARRLFGHTRTGQRGRQRLRGKPDQGATCCRRHESLPARR